MVTAPPIRRRLVGGALRRYRENLGYTLADAARILECDRSKVSRIESGQRGVRWYQSYADVLPDGFQDYLALEEGASKVMAYEAQRVPALLQTPAYARALARA